MLNLIYIKIIKIFFLSIKNFIFYRYTALITRKREYKLVNCPSIPVRRSDSPGAVSLIIGRFCAVAFRVGDGHGTSIGYNILSKIKFQKIFLPLYYYRYLMS